MYMYLRRIKNHNFLNIVDAICTLQELLESLSKSLQDINIVRFIIMLFTYTSKEKYYKTTQHIWNIKKTSARMD